MNAFTEYIQCTQSLASSELPDKLYEWIQWLHYQREENTKTERKTVSDTTDKKM